MVFALQVGDGAPLHAQVLPEIKKALKKKAPTKKKPDAKQGEAKPEADKSETSKSTKEKIPGPGPHPLPAKLPKNPRVVVVDLHGEVSLGMSSFVERVCASTPAGSLLVLDINTFGGRIDAAVLVRDALLALDQRGVTTVAYVHPRAISAGALISLASKIIVVAPGSTIGATAPVQMDEGGGAKPAGEKVVSYMRKEMRSTAEVYKRNGDVAEAMVDQDVEVPGLVAKGKLLTLDGKGALEWGLASFSAVNLTELLGRLGYKKPGVDHKLELVGWNWGEKLSGWLSSATVSGLLMSIGMLGILIGLYTGGSPGPLVLGGLCLALFFFGQYLTQLAGLEDVLLLLLGLILVAVEAVHPGLIVPGLLGAVCILASLALGLVSFEKVPASVQLEAGMIKRAVATVMGAIFFTAVLMFMAVKLLPRSRFGRALVLEAAVDGRASRVPKPHDVGFVGAEGIVETDLRPAGKVRIGGERFEAQAELGYLEAGTRVRVVQRRGFSLVVQRIEDEGEA